MLSEENQLSNNSTSTNILQQMQLFDFNRPKDITTIIEVVQENNVVKEKTLNVKKKSNLSKKKSTPNEKTKRQKKTPKERISKSSQHQRDQVCSRNENRNTGLNDVIGNYLQKLQPLQNENRINIPNISATQRCSPLTKNKDAFIEQATWHRSAHSTNFLESIQQMCSGQNISLQVPNEGNHPMPIGAITNTSKSVQNVNEMNHSSQLRNSLNIIVSNMIHVLTTRKSVENGNPYLKADNERFNFENTLRMFQHCYKHVVTSLLPQENNMSFVNNFIWKIVNIAKSKSIIIQYYYAHRLLFQMLEWCKRRRMSETPQWRYPHNPPRYTTPPDTQASGYPHNPPTYTTPPHAQASGYPHNPPRYTTPPDAQASGYPHNPPRYTTPPHAPASEYPHNPPRYTTPLDAQASGYPHNPPRYTTPPHAQASGYHPHDDSSHTPCNDSNKVGQTTCLFSLGSPGRQLTINMDSNLYNKFHNQAQDHGNNMDSKKIHENQNFHERKTPKLCEMTVNPTADSNKKPASGAFIEIEIPKNDNTENINDANITCYKGSSIPNNVSHNILNENVEHCNTHHNVFKEKEIPIVNWYSLPINYTNHKNMASCNNSVNVTNNLHQQVQNTNNDLGLKNQAEVSRSSLSRDSGFMSPLNFNGLDDQTSPVLPNEEVTPIITHVTSLNNNAAYITKSHCNVCTRETNKQCIGCYKIYYCSRECQQSEWHLHKFACF